MEGKTFATAINCMDGRTQLPIIKFLKDKYEVDYVDSITEAGVDGLLAKNENKSIVENVNARIGVSTEKHHSKYIAVVGHYDCAGNPGDKEHHIEDVKKACDLIKSWGFNAEVIGLWVDENWNVNEI